MTGHQDHPGTGKTLMGTPAPALSIAEIGKACGIKRVVTVDPYNLEATIKAVGEEIAADEPSLIISEKACVLHEPKLRGEPLCIDEDVCRECGQCLKLGCPGIEAKGKHPWINEQLCTGCGMCIQICKFDAISVAKESK
jgi:indolepyruvate ferredoxin oxidoreductase, alpha subunit